MARGALRRAWPSPQASPSFLLVLSAALRSPAVVGGVPQLAVSALVLCLVLYTAAVVGALLTPPRPVRVVADEPELERLAA